MYRKFLVRMDSIDLESTHTQIEFKSLVSPLRIQHDTKHGSESFVSTSKVSIPDSTENKCSTEQSVTVPKSNLIKSKNPYATSDTKNTGGSIQSRCGTLQSKSGDSESEAMQNESAKDRYEVVLNKCEEGESEVVQSEPEEGESEVVQSEHEEGASEVTQTALGEGESEIAQSVPPGEGESGISQSLPGEGESEISQSLPGEGESEISQSLPGEGESKIVQSRSVEDESVAMRSKSVEDKSETVQKRSVKGKSAANESECEIRKIAINDSQCKDSKIKTEESECGAMEIEFGKGPYSSTDETSHMPAINYLTVEKITEKRKNENEYLAKCLRSSNSLQSEFEGQNVGSQNKVDYESEKMCLAIIKQNLFSLYSRETNPELKAAVQKCIDSFNDMLRAYRKILGQHPLLDYLNVSQESSSNSLTSSAISDRSCIIEEPKVSKSSEISLSTETASPSSLKSEAVTPEDTLVDKSHVKFSELIGISDSESIQGDFVDEVLSTDDTKTKITQSCKIHTFEEKNAVLNNIANILEMCIDEIKKVDITEMHNNDIRNYWRRKLAENNIPAVSSGDVSKENLIDFYSADTTVEIIDLTEENNNVLKKAEMDKIGKRLKSDVQSTDKNSNKPYVKVGDCSKMIPTPFYIPHPYLAPNPSIVLDPSTVKKDAWFQKRFYKKNEGNTLTKKKMVSGVISEVIQQECSSISISDTSCKLHPAETDACQDDSHNNMEEGMEVNQCAADSGNGGKNINFKQTPVNERSKIHASDMSPLELCTPTFVNKSTRHTRLQESFPEISESPDSQRVPEFKVKSPGSLSPMSPVSARFEFVDENLPETFHAEIDAQTLDSRELTLSPPENSDANSCLIEIAFVCDNVNPGSHVIYMPDKLYVPPPGKESADYTRPLIPIFQVKLLNVTPSRMKQYEEISMEECLKKLRDLQDLYYEKKYFDNDAHMYRTILRTCVIPMRGLCESDNDLELVGDSLEPSSHGRMQHESLMQSLHQEQVESRNITDRKKAVTEISSKKKIDKESSADFDDQAKQPMTLEQSKLSESNTRESKVQKLSSERDDDHEKCKDKSFSDLQLTKPTEIFSSPKKMKKVHPIHIFDFDSTKIDSDSGGSFTLDKESGPSQKKKYPKYKKFYFKKLLEDHVLSKNSIFAKKKTEETSADSEQSLTRNVDENADIQSTSNRRDFSVRNDESGHSTNALSEEAGKKLFLDVWDATAKRLSFGSLSSDSETHIEDNESYLGEDQLEDHNQNKSMTDSKRSSPNSD